MDFFLDLYWYRSTFIMSSICLFHYGPFPVVQVNVTIGIIEGMVVLDIVPLAVHPIFHGTGMYLIISSYLRIVHRFLFAYGIDQTFVPHITAGSKVPVHKGGMVGVLCGVYAPHFFLVCIEGCPLIGHPPLVVHCGNLHLPLALLGPLGLQMGHILDPLRVFFP